MIRLIVVRVVDGAGVMCGMFHCCRQNLISLEQQPNNPKLVSHWQNSSGCRFGQMIKTQLTPCLPTAPGILLCCRPAILHTGQWSMTSVAVVTLEHKWAAAFVSASSAPQQNPVSLDVDQLNPSATGQPDMQRPIKQFVSFLKWFLGSLAWLSLIPLTLQYFSCLCFSAFVPAIKCSKGSIKYERLNLLCRVNSIFVAGERRAMYGWIQLPILPVRQEAQFSAKTSEWGRRAASLRARWGLH